MRPATGHANPENKVVRRNRVEIFALIRRLGRDLLFAGRVEPCLEKMILKTISAILRNLFEGITQLFVSKNIAAGKQIDEIIQDLLDRLYVAFVTVKQKLVSACTDAHVEQGFEIFNVLILNAEERVESVWW